MNILVIGWYGTETIGDRAILAGILSFLNKAFGNFSLTIGSLFPFFSERTINEDYPFWKDYIGKDFKVEIIDSRKSKCLIKAINKSDLVVMGGGPLMHINELYMIEYAFKKAQKLGKKTALLGCGVGPLFTKQHKKTLFRIIKASSLTILRDFQSKVNLFEIATELRYEIETSKVLVSIDPSIECCYQFINMNFAQLKEESVVINLRSFPLEYGKSRTSGNIDYELEKLVSNLSEKYSSKEIRLIPMHYFHIGNDDRVLLNSIALNLNRENISVQNSNLTLKETIETFQNACFNIGMRFHSVVLQTIVSGKNYVLDYTEPQKGKIAGFLKDIDKKGFYDNRYIQLQENEITIDMIKNCNDKFIYNIQDIDAYLNIYIKELKDLAK